MASKLDVMIDLETVGKKAGCGILQIGACTFDEAYQFSIGIDPIDARKYLKEDPDTLRWWSGQLPEIREKAFSGTTPLIVALNSFRDWLGGLPAAKNDIEVWGNGADFDLPILQGAYTAIDQEAPWAPFSGRCYRTLKTRLAHVPMQTRELPKHLALNDAIEQARHARLLLQML
jgi:hypothetical protein